MPNYRVRTNIGYFHPGEVITEDQIARSRGNPQDWLADNAIEPTDEAPTPGTWNLPDRPLTDAENKARIENGMREETLRRGEPIPVMEQQAIAAAVTADSANRGKGRERVTGAAAEPAGVAPTAPAPAATEVPPAAQPAASGKPANGAKK